MGSVMKFNMGPLMEINMGKSMKPMTVLVEKMNELLMKPFSIDGSQEWYVSDGCTNCGHSAYNIAKALTGCDMTYAEFKKKAETQFAKSLELGNISLLDHALERARGVREQATIDSFERATRGQWILS